MPSICGWLDGCGAQGYRGLTECPAFCLFSHWWALGLCPPLGLVQNGLWKVNAWILAIKTFFFFILLGWWPQAELLDYLIFLCVAIWETSILWTTHKGSSLGTSLPTFFLFCFVLSTIFMDVKWYLMWLCLALLNGQWGWVSFHVSIGHLHTLLREISVQVLWSFSNRDMFAVVELWKFITCSSRHILCKHCSWFVFLLSW